MSLPIIAEVWDLMSYYIEEVDRLPAAITLVNVLIDNDYSASDIKDTFIGEKEVTRALKAYIDSDEEEDEEDDEDDDDDDENNW